MPCVNPDGYVYNELNNPDGGGLWRKNRRANDDGTFGVDLNRNYGFKWGFDDFGSSPIPISETYRGTEPFSEPETQAIRHLCLQHDFGIALNYHSYGNFLIYPFGYTDESFAVYESFAELARVLTSQNNYVFGTGVETVAYLTNGDSDDWMFGDNESKKEIFALTPEVGSKNDWFWPETDRIIPLSKENVFQNLQAASFLLNSTFPNR